MTEKNHQDPADEGAAADEAAAPSGESAESTGAVPTVPAEALAEEDENGLLDVEDADVETASDATSEAQASEDGELTDEELSFLEAGERDLLADMRNDLARAQAELVNFRMRVERDRAANRDAVIAEVIRSVLPAIDDLDRAEAHGDLAGSPLELVAQKLHAAFAKYGLKSVGEKGEVFDPHLHEALVQLPTPDITVNTVADVIEPGYALGDKLLRAAKVAVAVPDGK
jgi:molecular chaperone GrpE